MVSSGISTGVSPVRPVEAPMGNTARNSDTDFNTIMSQQTLSAGTDPEKNRYAGQSVQNTSTLMNTAPQTEKRVKNASENISAPEKDSTAANDKPAVTEPDAVDKAAETVREIKDKIKEEFGVSDEDIEKALETLGMTMADLLDESNLTDFVVELTGMENAVELLVSPEISGQLAELSEFIQNTVAELSEELNIPAEELSNLLKEAEAETKLPVSETSVLPVAMTAENVLPEDNVKNDESDKTGAEQWKQNADAAEPQNGNGIPVKVEKTQESTSPENHHSDMAKGGDTPHMVNTMVENFTAAVNEAFEMQGLDEGVHAAQIIEQIVEAAKVTLSQEVTSMELMLNPESLGRINMTVSVKEGVVTATLTAQNEAAREAIESQIVMLKENLNNQGIKVEAVEVTVESHAFEANASHEQNNAFHEQREQERKRTGRPLRLDSLEDLDMEELTEEERIVMDMMANEGNQVNFTA